MDDGRVALPERPPAGVPGEPAGMDRPLSAVVRRPPVTCLPSDSIESALRTMSAEAVGSLIVTDEERKPAGIFTLHDLLRRVALPRKDLADPIASVMSPVRVTLPSHATAYDAALEMVRQGVRHVIVVDRGGQLTGIVSEKDLFELQRLSLRQLSNEITGAPDIGALAVLAGEVRRLAQSRLIEGVSSEQLTRLISSLNDLLTRRVLELEFAGKRLRREILSWLISWLLGPLQRGVWGDSRALCTTVRPESSRQVRGISVT